MTKIISIDGPSGAGKSTLINVLERRLRQAGQMVQVSSLDSIPSCYTLQEQARGYPLGSQIRTMLFLSMRIMQYQLIQVERAKFDYVIMDRSLLSQIAIDQFGCQVPQEVFDWIRKKLPFTPDVQLILRVPLAVSRSRKPTSPTTADDAYAQRIEEGFKQIAKALQLRVIDGNRPLEEVVNEVMDIIL